MFNFRCKSSGANLQGILPYLPTRPSNASFAFLTQLLVTPEFDLRPQAICSKTIRQTRAERDLARFCVCWENTLFSCLGSLQSFSRDFLDNGPAWIARKRLQYISVFFANLDP